MNIDLNSGQFDQKQGKAVFNGGAAGLVNNTVISVEKKTKDGKEGSPDYKIIFTDGNESSCNTSLWYVTKETQYASIEKQIQKQGKILKHLAHAILGSTYQFPPFDSAEAMLDGIMSEIRKGLPKAGKFRMFANYGTVDYPKAFIQPRSWVPFLESMSVSEEESRLVKGDIDQMDRKEKDTFVQPSSSSSNGAVSDDDEW
jgi:hypothetical protein|tara:strand:+ start:2648 stop:3247 length:600 start_codon:yes stop_codon:yes gene_type:complete